MACRKCGKPLVKADRGNIALGIPDGFDHVDCGKAAYMEVPPEIVKEKSVIIAKEVKEDEKSPFKKGGRDSIFKRRLS